MRFNLLLYLVFYVFLWGAGILLPLQVHAESDSTQAVNYASLTAGVDSDSGSQFAAYLDLVLAESLRLNAGIGEVSATTVDETFTTRQVNLSLAGNVGTGDSSAFTWAAGVQTWGKKEVIETQDRRISAGYIFSTGWNFSVDYETGSLEVFIKPQFAQRLQSISSGRNAWRLTTGFTTTSSSGWVSFLSRDYEKDLTAFTRRDRLQLAVKSIALSQAYALSKEEFTIGYEWFFEEFDLGGDYNRVTSVVDNHRNEYVSIYTRLYIGEAMTADFRVEQEVNDSFTVFTAGVGLVW